MRAIKYRELKRMYEMQRAGADRQALAGGPASRRSEAPGFQHPRIGRGDPEPGAGPSDGPPPGRRLPLGGRRRRGRHRLLEHHRPDHPIHDPRGLHAGGVRALEAGRHDPHAAGRRADSRHRTPERRGVGGAAGHALSQPGVRRGLHRHPADHQARVHRPGDQGSGLLRPHVPDPPAGRGSRRGAGPEQGEAAAGPADRRRPTTTTGREAPTTPTATPARARPPTATGSTS